MTNTLKISGMAMMLLFAVSSCKKNEQKPQMEGDGSGEVQKEQINHPKTTATFSKESHDFGNLKKGDMVQHVFEVTNTGTQPLIIGSVVPACGCTIPEYTKEPIAPGQKGKITLGFDSKNFSGEVTKTAEIHMNTDKSPVTLSFKANVQ